MAVQIGDKVRFLNDVGSGVVIRIEKNMVYVSDKDGFERPAQLSQVVVVDSVGAQQKRAVKEEFKEKNSELKSVIKTAITTLENDNTIYLVIAPEKYPLVENSRAELYLLNDSNYLLLYNIFRTNEEKSVTTLKAGFLEPNTRESLIDFKINQIDTTIGYQIIQYMPIGKYTPNAPLVGEIKLRSLDIVQSKEFRDSPFFDQKSLIIDLKSNKTDLSRMLVTESKKDIITHSNSLKAQKQKNDINEIIEIDLHIEQLLDDPRNLLPAECLTIQLDTVRKTMRDHLKERGKRIVFIHGVGNGRLKSEVLRVLSREFPKCKTQDASFQEYGFGATRVVIR